MQLFLFLNDLAKRSPLFDEVARFFYVGALPALGTLLLAQLLLLPRGREASSRSKMALALVLALALGAFVVWGIGELARAWNLGTLSPRPWMTRRVNWLVVEPQDDSFPCIEVLFAAVFAVASAMLNRRIGAFSAVLAGTLGLARMFCGNNYFADVLVGALLGAGSMLLCAALIEFKIPFRERLRPLWSGTTLLGGTLLGVYGFAAISPRWEGKLGRAWGVPAAAAPSPGKVERSSPRGAQSALGEGEGLAPDDEGAEELALAKRSSLFLPDVEAFLQGKLAPVARPFTLLDVEVAPVKAGTTSYRCAALRFEFHTSVPNARRQVANCAARLVQHTFELDSQVQNVDVVCIVRGQGRDLDRSLLRFAGDEVPIFTASIQRKNRIVPSPAWANAPGLDGGLWLRTRSLIYVNDLVLPDSATLVSPTPTSPAPSTPKTTPTAMSTPLPAPTKRAAPAPQPKRTTLPPASRSAQLFPANPLFSPAIKRPPSPRAPASP